MMLAPRISSAVAVLIALATACSDEAAAQPSLIPALEELEPAIHCMDTASTQRARWECAKGFGISEDYRFPEQPKKAEDFQRQALVLWASLAQGEDAHVSSAQFDAAIEYAACIEKATNALQGLKGDPRRAISAARATVEANCVGEKLSPQAVAAKNPGLLAGHSDAVPMDKMKAFLLARIFSGSSFSYIVEANDWVTDAMRPCVRYGDGRPPSPGCKGRTEGPAPAPPPGAYGEYND